MKNRYAYYYVIYLVNGHRRSQMFYREYELKQWYLSITPVPSCVTNLTFYRSNDPLGVPAEWLPDWAR